MAIRVIGAVAVQSGHSSSSSQVWVSPGMGTNRHRVLAVGVGDDQQVAGHRAGEALGVIDHADLPQGHIQRGGQRPTQPRSPLPGVPALMAGGKPVGVGVAGSTGGAERACSAWSAWPLRCTGAGVLVHESASDSSGTCGRDSALRVGDSVGFPVSS